MAEPAVTIYRGRSAEAIHYASIAVVDKDGRLTHCLGDPEMVFMTRSLIKPFQLMPLLMTGAADDFGFSPERLAIMCGSHVGSDRHREVVLSNLELAGNRPEHLKCGSHWPLWMQIEKVYPTKGEDRDSLRHNCSGKHSGFLALARFLGDDVADYLEPESKAQRLVKTAVARYCEYDESRMHYGVDGCSAPNYPLPLVNLARAFKKLASAEGEIEGIRAIVKRIREAMIGHPLMVSGEKRFDYDLQRSFPGNVVCKVGAESIEGIGFFDPPIGIAVKVHDGNSRALGPVCIEALKQLGIVKSIDDFPYLKSYEMPDVRNDRDIVTGKMAAEFRLKKI